MNIHTLDDASFTDLCKRIVSDLGMEGDRLLRGNRGTAYRVELERVSSDALFHTTESWFCLFLRPPLLLDDTNVDQWVQVTLGVRVDYLLVVVFGVVATEVEARLRTALAREGVAVVLFADDLALMLANDDRQSAERPAFSFADLREHVRQLVETAPWHQQFQTISIQPARLVPLHGATPDRRQWDDDALTEADLVRAVRQGSLLLLGDPGSGKTTSLLAFGRELAVSGGLTPVMVSLGGYRGSLWDLLCQALAPGRAAVELDVARALVESGGLVLLLDGVNEVQNPALQQKLVDEINQITDPSARTSRSLWIVSGRVQDYEQSRLRLRHLETRRWELQPLTADLVYRYLAEALGESEATLLYRELSPAVREICTNPLLLSMVFAVYQETGQIAAGRGALYHEFVGLLLDWGDERAVDGKIRSELDGLLPERLTGERFRMLAEHALTAMVATMATTVIEWGAAMNLIAQTLVGAEHPPRAASLLLEILIQRGLLRRDAFHRVRFFHHTMQEYFQARNLTERSPAELIPDGGVDAAHRETVIFVAGMKQDPSALIERAIQVDTMLAFELLRDAYRPLPRLSALLARQVWQVIQQGGGVRGHKRRIAQLFQRIAALRRQDAEELAAEIDASLSHVDQVGRLVKFYGELGNSRAQQRILNTAIRGKKLPDSLLKSAAWTAYKAGEYERSIDLYTRCIDLDSKNGSAYNSRALCYKALGQHEAALADFDRALELEGHPVHHTNFARLLDDLGRRDEALHHVEMALQKDPSFATAHSLLADYIQADDPKAALEHRERAVRYAPHDEDQRIYLRKLADLQEQLGQHAGGIRSLRELIALEPTSREVGAWKQRIAHLRQQLDEQLRTRSLRERLHEQDELPLPAMTVEWLKAAGFQIRNLTETWLLVSGGRGQPNDLPLALALEPVLTGTGMRQLIDSLPQEWRRASQVVIVTVTDALTSEAHHQLAALQDQYRVALVTALEIRDALLQSDTECYRLLDRALKHTGLSSDPYAYKGIVTERTEFFGRAQELKELVTLLGSGQQVGLYGIHKIGKSSLLEQLRLRLHVIHPEITVIKVELDAALRDAGDVYSLILRRLPGAMDVTSAGLTAAAFRKALTAFHQRAERERPGHRVLLMIDEYAYLLPDQAGNGGLKDFISVLGTLKALHQEGWLLVLPCGRTAALNRQVAWGRDENPFINLLHSRFLGPMPRDENDALMNTLGLRAQTQVRYMPEALAAIYTETGGHPSFSRSLGSHILRGGGGQISAKRVERAIESLLSDNDHYAFLVGVYRKLDQEEQRIARELAWRGPLARSKLFPLFSGIPARELVRDALNNLLDTTVLVQQPGGKIAHRYGLFRRAICKEMRELGR